MREKLKTLKYRPCGWRRFIRLWKQNPNATIVMGDSHSNFFSGNEDISFIPLGRRHPGVNFCDDRLDAFRTLHLGPALAYNANKYGTTTMAREKAERLVSSGLLHQGANILCCFGEIDLRVAVLKQAKIQKTTTDDIIDKVISNYMEFLLFLKDKGFNVFAWGPVATQLERCAVNPVFPAYGSEKDRNIATEIFNRKLKHCCRKNGIGFVSIFKYLIDGNYRTKEEFICSDNCHLSQKAWIFANDELEKYSLMRSR